VRLFGRQLPLGTRGEWIAARFLRRNKYRVLLRNVRSALGELDLICLAPDRSTIVFVEVKTRAVSEGARSLPPESNITAHKRRKLLLLADAESRRRGWEDKPRRIDVVTVECPRRGKPLVRHFESAVVRTR
jgi:putative endonuclease